MKPFVEAGRSSPKFVSFEGIDGCGKSTLMAHLATWLEEENIPHIQTREPGGTRLGETLRKLLLDPTFSGMHPWAEITLYASSRAQHVHEVIRPALEQGLWVLTDRYADAMLAYQGYGHGLELPPLLRLHAWSTQDLWPDQTILLDCQVETAFRRRWNRSGSTDRLEMQDEAFHNRVRKGYLELAAANPHRTAVLDADRPLSEVIGELRKLFQAHMNIRSCTHEG